LDTSGIRSEGPGKFIDMVLEKDGEDQLDRSFRNEVLHVVKEDRNILYTIKKEED